MLLISLVCTVMLAIYCLTQGLMLAALFALLGVIPGPGFLPMIACAVTLLAAGQGWVALLPFLIVAWNLWSVSRLGHR